MFYKREFSSKWWLVLAPFLILTIFGLLSLSNQHSAAQVPETKNLADIRAILILQVNYAHDGVEGIYETGHTVLLTVTDQLKNIKATAQLETQAIPWWEPGETGFSTYLGSPWEPAVPNIVPGDWVYAEIDDEQTAEVQVGEIDGTLDISNDTVEGDVYLYWLSDTLQGRCSVLEEGGPTIEFEVESDHGEYSCDLAAQGWDLQRGHHVAVQYQDPNGHWVINVIGKEWQIYLPLVLH
jgi:hypothetical protein